MSQRTREIWMVPVGVLLVVGLALLPGCGGSGGVGGPLPGNGNVDIPPVAAPPVAVNDSVTMAFTLSNITNAAVTLAASDLLGNDTNGDVASIAAVNAAGTQGTVVLNDDGSVTYAPPPGFSGTTTFGYTAANTVNATLQSSATVNITVDAKQVWFVQNNAAPGGDGSQNAPFATLLAAESASGAGDTIFVLTGIGTIGQDQGIILKDGQRLIGQGVALTVPWTVNAVARDLVVANAGVAPAITNTGGRILPPGPIFAQADGVGVFLAGGNEVAGLSIESTLGEGVLGIEVSGFSIHDNVLKNTIRDGIQLMDPSGVAPVVNEIRANQFIDIALDPARRDRAIRIDNGVQDLGAEVITTGTTVELLIDGNVISGAGADGIRVDALGTVSSVTALITGNEVRGAGAVGITAASTAPVPVPPALPGSPRLDIRIRGNTIEGNAGGGIVLAVEAAELSADVSNNPSISNNGRKGIVLAASADSSVPIVTIVGDTITGNTEEGMVITVADATQARIGVRDNILSGNNLGLMDVLVTTSALVAPGPNLCMQFTGNQAAGTGGFRLQQTAGTFNLENPAQTTNTPPPLMVGVVTLVDPGSCISIPPTTP
ncbi:MAG: right-handed parallel beta-helix repeat-containing protein [Sideroxyarcus sp.]|nr:right-handed parallel beta-helix repeat-containing protein [Sideroxyarcus sp.]